MKQSTYYIGHSEVKQCGIGAKDCVDMVTQSFKMKYQSQLPPKISIHPRSDDFINTMPCLLPEKGAAWQGGPLTLRLLRYKDQAEQFAQQFDGEKGVECQIVDTIDELVDNCDVLVSCVTSANGLFVPDESVLKPGFLLVPVHTRGFQNCDLTFDKIFGDDRGHVCGFKYFNQFKSFHEFSEVLLGQVPGRESDDERIIC